MTTWLRLLLCCCCAALVAGGIDPPPMSESEFLAHAESLQLNRDDLARPVQAYSDSIGSITRATERLSHYAQSLYPMHYGTVEDSLTKRLSDRVQEADSRQSALLREAESHYFDQLVKMHLASPEQAQSLSRARLRRWLLDPRHQVPLLANIPGLQIDVPRVVAEAIEIVPDGVDVILLTYEMELDELIRLFDGALLQHHQDSGVLFRRAFLSFRRAPGDRDAESAYLHAELPPIRIARRIHQRHDRVMREILESVNEEQVAIMSAGFDDARYRTVVADDQYLALLDRVKALSGLSAGERDGMAAVTHLYRSERSIWMKSYIDQRQKLLSERALRSHFENRVRMMPNPSTITTGLANAALTREMWLRRVGDLASDLLEALSEEHRSRLE